ncbi:MAG: hypothetical protein OEV31_00135 [Gammaproteobacteria bacterium]|nr:hypothetical protein [Gammaproteobacteria bacterium]
MKLTRTRFILPAFAALLALLLAGGCSKKETPSQPTVQRTDFSPEEFGMGRAHTRNAGCNREIDAIMDITRLCVNSGQGKACDPVREKNSERISRIKNSARCQH